MHYRLLQNTKILADCGIVKKLPKVLAEAGYQKPFLVSDKGLKNTPLIPYIQGILEEAKIDYVYYGEITPDPVCTLVDEGARLCKESQCDCVLAIGGGSTLDAAKGISIMRQNTGSILDYVGNERNMTAASGMIAIPTTSGTGSELSNWIVITDTEKHDKHPINVVNSMCEYAILDPELVKDLPAAITASTGLDAFSHAFEAYTSRFSNMVTDLICEKIMETVIRWLPVAVADGHNLEARKQMMVAATLGGWMLRDGLVHIGHCISHEIGATYHIPHGAGCAYAFPPMIYQIKNAWTDKIRYTGELLGLNFQADDSADLIADRTAKAYIHFRDELVKLPSIQTFHPDPGKADLVMANRILKDSLTSLCPAKLTVEDILVMLYQILM